MTQLCTDVSYILVVWNRWDRIKHFVWFCVINIYNSMRISVMLGNGFYSLLGLVEGKYYCNFQMGLEQPGFCLFSLFPISISWYTCFCEFYLFVLIDFYSISLSSSKLFHCGTGQAHWFWYQSILSILLQDFFNLCATVGTINVRKKKLKIVLAPQR